MQKSINQNSVFHKLLEIYWESGVSSFISYEALRDYYKKIAGLIEVEYSNSLSEEAKNYLWHCIKAGKRTGALDTDSYMEVVELLKGRVIKHKSWGSVSKKKATLAINTLLDDMFKSGVLRQEILKL